MNYVDFLTSKAPRVERCGVESLPLAPLLYPFQADVVRWAVRLGRAAVFADTGMGKTLMQLEWARHFVGRVLVVAPIGVAEQTIAEGRRIELDVRRVREPSEMRDGINITNYERLAKFVGVSIDALVLDEASILKSFDGKTRNLLIDEFSRVPRRLCCTATPAPNDVTELANYAEFLGLMSRAEMLATFFVHDSCDSAIDGWRLKGHAAAALYEWMATWAVYIRRPSDLGYADDGFVLPSLSVRDETVPSNWRPAGMLLAVDIGGVGERAKLRRHTLAARVAKAAEIVATTPGQWLVWCGLNDEQDAFTRAVGPQCVSIQGKDAEASKLERESSWRHGDARILVTKPDIFGFGMNWQHCHQMIFLGLGDSWESYYQAIRRCWRHGQKEAVDVRIVISDVEGQIAANVRAKENRHARTADGVVMAMREAQMREIRGAERRTDEYRTGDACGEDWDLLLGDCVERIVEVASESVGLSVYSPPFAALYTYSASDRDLGNSKDYDEFFRHFGFLVPKLLRVTMPGRRTAVHVQQVTTTKATHGVISWRDFRADVVRLYQSHGWVYDGEVVIDKDPQAQAIRTKSKQLMFVQKERDAAWLRPAMADYILLFRHPGENLVPVKSDVSNEEWILWARPIWYGIRESGTLQGSEAREDKDEKHVCPLQLETIERCVRLWSNPGELVLSPFAGIGSEGYVALKSKRRFIGIELKEAYWKVAVKNLSAAVAQKELF